MANYVKGGILMFKVLLMFKVYWEILQIGIGIKMWTNLEKNLDRVQHNKNGVIF